MGLIKSAVLYDIPIIFSHVAVGLSGYEPMIKELSKLAPNAVFIDRTNVNAWEEPEFVAAVEAIFSRSGVPTSSTRKPSTMLDADQRVIARENS